MKRCHSCNNVELLTKAMFCSECGNKLPLKKKFSIRKRLVGRKSLVLILIILVLIGITPNNPFLFETSAYNVYQDNSVDADSDIDAVANIGDDGATSYINAQTVNADDQIITEGNGAGYVAGVDIDELHDAITDTQTPTDTGTYSNDANMQSDDGTMNTLTEANNPTAGVDEWVAVDGIDGTAIWGTTGTTPWIDIQDQPTNLISTGSNGLVSQWYTFGSTSGSGTGFTVNASIYDVNNGDGYVDWEVDWTGDGTADASGAFTSQAAYGWQNTGTITGLDTDTEINAARIRFSNNKGAGGPNTDSIDAARLGISQAGGDNYRFDREFQFSSITSTTETNEELTINTGTIGTESLQVYVWEASAWALVTTIVDANDNTWVNVSISTWMDSAIEYFSFRDATITTDTGQNTWEIDYVGLHLWTDEVSDYELQWEHQSNTVDIHKDTYQLAIYGSATENMEIQTWNIGGSTWNTPLATQISSTEQWYNQTIDANAIGTSIAWRYRGTAETGDTSQSTLNIDYAGIAAWNHTMDIIETTFGISDYKQDSGNVSITENPIRINVTSGISYTIEVSATDGSGSPIANLYLFMDTDSNPVGAIQLTTSWQVMYSGLSPADGSISFIYLWLDVPFGVNDQVLTMTLNVRIIPA